MLSFLLFTHEHQEHVYDQYQGVAELSFINDHHYFITSPFSAFTHEKQFYHFISPLCYQ